MLLYVALGYIVFLWAEEGLQNLIFVYKSIKQKEIKMAKDVFDQMADSWGSEIVARTQIEKFTGGMISSKYMANLDSQGLGPEERVKIGRKTGYPVASSLIPWLRERSSK